MTRNKFLSSLLLSGKVEDEDEAEAVADAIEAADPDYFDEPVTPSDLENAAADLVATFGRMLAPRRTNNGAGTEYKAVLPFATLSIVLRFGDDDAVAAKVERGYTVERQRKAAETAWAKIDGQRELEKLKAKLEAVQAA